VAHLNKTDILCLHLNVFFLIIYYILLLFVVF
jgi:hypothetical protein